MKTVMWESTLVTFVTLSDSPNSFAHIAVINGTARGYIHIPGHTTYHIEPSTMYFHDPPFHTVIYPESHMDLDPYRLVDYHCVPGAISIFRGTQLTT